MKKLGIILLITPDSGGVYQYAQALIDNLPVSNSRQYVIFTYEENLASLSTSQCEVRVVPHYTPGPLIHVVAYLLRSLGIQVSWLLKKSNIHVFSDIDSFICPYVGIYPHYYLHKPYIFTLHDLQEKYYPEYFNYIERLKRHTMNKIVSSKARKILCESEYVKQDIVKFVGKDKDNIAVVQFPPPDLFNTIVDVSYEESVINKLELPKKYIFYPAQFWPHKNHLNLISAFKIVSEKIENIHLILSGTKKEAFDKVWDQVEYLGLSEKVRYIGYVDYKDLYYIYKNSLFLVMPSYFESISIPVYEAFSAKVAVCISNITALPEQAGDAALYFNPSDVEEMAIQICKLTSDDNLRSELATRGYNKIKDYDYDGFKNQIEKIIKSIL